jgi:molybdopterin converting factor subunit 1
MIKILLFAGLSDAVGSPTVTLPLSAERATVEDVKNMLIQEFPNIKELLSKSMAAVNQEYADESTVVNESDEIAFIPPVSGG